MEIMGVSSSCFTNNWPFIFLCTELQEPYPWLCPGYPQQVPSSGSLGEGMTNDSNGIAWVIFYPCTNHSRWEGKVLLIGRSAQMISPKSKRLMSPIFVPFNGLSRKEAYMPREKGLQSDKPHSLS